jgi:hypothetical protein
MAKIYRKVILGQETNFFYCDACLNEANEPQMGWVSRYVEAIVPGDGNAGVWKEAPLEECGLCYAVDLQAQEEMNQYSHDMDQLSYEEDQFAADQELWEAHIRDPQSGVKL